MQSEIATAIARELSVRLTDQERAALSRVPTENAKAFEQYVLGHAALVSFALDKGLRHLEAAIELDPNFALAMAELSMAHTGRGGVRGRSFAGTAWRHPGRCGSRTPASRSADDCHTLPGMVPLERSITPGKPRIP
ncbi:MAG: hypothetical protein HYR49_01820 [Gammaproteobacteria bacterium]|nr:hypothetical protein [Gammaproteobacteria bacterium]